MVILTNNRRKFFDFLRKQKSRKVKSATLIESLVASVIIIIIFTIASLTLNNVFESSIKNNTNRVRNRINELNYLYINDKVKSPYQEDFEDWNIRLLQKTEGQKSFMLLEAVRKETKKNISQKLEYSAGN